MYQISYVHSRVPNLTVGLNKSVGVIHYLKNKVGVVDFANAQGVVKF